MISFISYIDFNDKIFFKFLFTFFYIEISFVTLHGYSDIKYHCITLYRQLDIKYIQRLKFT